MGYKTETSIEHALGHLGERLDHALFEEATAKKCSIYKGHGCFNRTPSTLLAVSEFVFTQTVSHY